MDENDIREKGFHLISKYRGAIMGIAALWIFFFHTWTLMSVTPQEGSFNLIYFLEIYLKKIGFVGVDIFFFLSGIGLTFAIKKESTFTFFYKRLRRIALPPLVIGIILGITCNQGLAETIRNISGYNFFTKDIYSFLWFVHVIIIFYILFPLYWKLFAKAENKILFTISLILIWLIITLLVRDSLRFDFFGFTNRIPIFLLGILIGYLTQKHKDTVFSLNTYITLTIALTVGLYLAYLANFKKLELIVPCGNCFLPNFLIASSLTFLIAKLLEITERHFPRFGKAVVTILSFFGSISLELYCVQIWLLEWESIFRIIGWPAYLINLLMFLCTTTVAWIMSVLFKSFWELVELPFKLRSKKSI